MHIKKLMTHTRAHAIGRRLGTMTAALGLDPLEQAGRLAELQPQPGRGRLLRLRGDVLLLDDAYNANPDSVGAAIELLASAPGERWLVLGDLAELGPDAELLHRGLGERARAAGIDVLVCDHHLPPGADVPEDALVLCPPQQRGGPLDVGEPILVALLVRTNEQVRELPPRGARLRQQFGNSELQQGV